MPWTKKYPAIAREQVECGHSALVTVILCQWHWMEGMTRRGGCTKQCSPFWWWAASSLLCATDTLSSWVHLGDRIPLMWTAAMACRNSFWRNTSGRPSPMAYNFWSREWPLPFWMMAGTFYMTVFKSVLKFLGESFTMRFSRPPGWSFSHNSRRSPLQKGRVWISTWDTFKALFSYWEVYSKL